MCPPPGIETLLWFFYPGILLVRLLLDLLIGGVQLCHSSTGINLIAKSLALLGLAFVQYSSDRIFVMLLHNTVTCFHYMKTIFLKLQSSIGYCQLYIVSKFEFYKYLPCAQVHEPQIIRQLGLKRLWTLCVIISGYFVRFSTFVRWVSFQTRYNLHVINHHLSELPYYHISLPRKASGF